MTPEGAMTGIWNAYLITFGWAIVGSVSMAIGIIIALKLFDLSTPRVDEGELVKQGNIPIAIIFASLTPAGGYVMGACAPPGWGEESRRCSSDRSCCPSPCW